jgi:hypothetical protein
MSWRGLCSRIHTCQFFAFKSLYLHLPHGLLVDRRQNCAISVLWLLSDDSSPISYQSQQTKKQKNFCAQCRYGLFTESKDTMHLSEHVQSNQEEACHQRSGRRIQVIYWRIFGLTWSNKNSRACRKILI